MGMDRQIWDPEGEFISGILDKKKKKKHAKISSSKPLHC
jgi:hypothetical protein